MKTLLVVRHAKSSWSALGQADFDRPLNDRGHRDAPVMAQRMKARGLNPQMLITSTANRAKTTCKYFSEVFSSPAIQTLELNQLYHAPKHVFFEVLSSQPDEVACIFIFAHNPGITDFVNALTKNVALDNMPTCSCFAVRSFAESWRDITPENTELFFFDYPKNQSSV
jgi:phosphohistidine phosphatase